METRIQYYVSQADAHELARPVDSHLTLDLNEANERAQKYRKAFPAESFTVSSLHTPVVYIVAKSGFSENYLGFGSRLVEETEYSAIIECLVEHATWQAMMLLSGLELAQHHDARYDSIEEARECARENDSLHAGAGR